MNAHINYDLPEALLGSISDEEFDEGQRFWPTALEELGDLSR